jgi:hypothetical protein
LHSSKYGMYSEQNLLWFHYVPLKFHIDSSGIEPGFPQIKGYYYLQNVNRTLKIAFEYFV